MSEPEEENLKLDISPVLGTFLAQMPIPVDLVPHSSCYQLVPFEEDDGTKSIAVALAFSTGNNIQIVWFREADFRQFIQNSMMVHQEMLKQLAVANPLIVANQGQMQQVIQQKNMVDGKLILGGK